MLTDDEKALFKDGLTFEETHKFGLQNAKDIIACGFDMKKTFIFSDLEYISGHFLYNMWEFSKLLPFNQVRGAFGFDGSTNIGRIMFPAVQWYSSLHTMKNFADLRIVWLHSQHHILNCGPTMIRKQNARKRWPRSPA
jgi:tryptophanyl-tRNA synthetase